MTTTTSTSRRSSSSPRRQVAVEIRCSTVADGDFHLTRQHASALESRRRALVDRPWTMTDQVHGTGVVRVAAPGAGDRDVGDIAITDLDDAVLGVWAADCAPIVLVGADREFAVVHAGWRGLAAGVVDAAVEAFHDAVVELVLGPVIGPCCYEFGDDELAAVAAGVHARPRDLRGVTTTGRDALDVPLAVRHAADRHRIPMVRLGGCTGCGGPWFSHRVRRDAGRHVVAAWRPSTGPAR